MPLQSDRESFLAAANTPEVKRALGIALRELRNQRRGGGAIGRVLDVLAELGRDDPSFQSSSFEFHYRKHQHFSPRQMLLIASLLDDYGVSHDPCDFRVSTTSEKHKQHLRDFEPEQIERIWPFLTTAQQSGLADLQG